MRFKEKEQTKFNQPRHPDRHSEIRFGTPFVAFYICILFISLIFYSLKPSMGESTVFRLKLLIVICFKIPFSVPSPEKIATEECRRIRWRILSMP